MSEEIYNKNAKEKALLEEAYSKVQPGGSVIKEAKGAVGKWILKKFLPGAGGAGAGYVGGKHAVEEYTPLDDIAHGGAAAAGAVKKATGDYFPALAAGGGAYILSKMLSKKDDEEEENIDIDLSNIQVVDVEGLDPNENEQPNAYITKAYIQTENGVRELTDEEYEYINDYELEFVHDAAENELIDYKAGMEDFGEAEEANEGGDIDAAQDEMIQRAQAGENPHTALAQVADNHGVDRETLKKAIFGESKIYNKNAREKSLLEEAYTSVYREDTEKERRYEDKWGKDLDREREKPGGSNAGKYLNVDKKDLCGASGDSASGSYPVRNEDEAKAALRFAHYADDPEGIRRCVYRKYPHLNPKNKKEDEENPDAHTYSRRGEEPGPAAELDSEIGFGESVERKKKVIEEIAPVAAVPYVAAGARAAAPYVARGISALGKWLSRGGKSAASKASKTTTNLLTKPTSPLQPGRLGAPAGRRWSKAKIAGALEAPYLKDDLQGLYDTGRDVYGMARGDQAAIDRLAGGAPSRVDVMTGKTPGVAKKSAPSQPVVPKEVHHAQGTPTMSPSDEELGADDDPYGTLRAIKMEFEQELVGGGDGIDTNVNELKDYVDIIKGLNIDEGQKLETLEYLKELRGPGGRAGLEDVDFDFVFGEEDTFS